MCIRDSIRVGLAEAVQRGPGQWPWATFAVNMAGALLIGFLVGRLRDHPEDSLRHPFLMTGITGTLTTFSALQLELFELVDEGDLGIAAAYVGATMVIGYAFVDQLVFCSSAARRRRGEPRRLG